MAPYRPPGRSNRSGRTQADNDVLEGLPVKQWTHAPTRVSLVPPASEVPGEQGHDRWGEPPMPRDFQLLQPWTQQLLRLARSGKLGQKRKPTRDADDADGEDYGAREDDGNNGDDSNGLGKGSMLGEDRAFVAKKWRHVPEHALVPEHLHLEFLARSRKGLPSFYHNLNSETFGAPVPMRKTKVSRVLDAATGETAVYEILVPEGQPLENEVVEGSELADKEVSVLTVGTVVEGLGTANPDGVLVSEIRNAAAAAQRRNRPPPKKKGGPGRGKKRVTFTNPDGSTYTTIVPNATKIVPQPGQTVKHVAKGEEAAKDITAEEAASMKAAGVDHEGDHDEEGDDDEDGDEEGEGEEGDDREEGEVVEEGAETDTKPGTPQPNIEEATTTTTAITTTATAESDEKQVIDDTEAVDKEKKDETDAPAPAVDQSSAPIDEDLPMTTQGEGDAPIAAVEARSPQPPTENVAATADVSADIEMPDAEISAQPDEIVPAPLPSTAEHEPVSTSEDVSADATEQPAVDVSEPAEGQTADKQPATQDETTEANAADES